MQIEHLIDNLLEVMEAKKMTQKDLSKKSGVGESAISQYLSGARVPKLDNLYKISLALEVDLKDLLKVELGYSEWHEIYDKHKNRNMIFINNRNNFNNDFNALSKVYLKNLADYHKDLLTEVLSQNALAIEPPVDVLDAYNKALQCLRYSAMNMTIYKWVKIKQYLDWFKEADK